MEKIYILVLVFGMQQFERFSVLFKLFIQVLFFFRKDLRYLRIKDIYSEVYKMGNQSKGQENLVRVDMVVEMFKMVLVFFSQSREDQAVKGGKGEDLRGSGGFGWCQVQCCNEISFFVF